MTTDKYTIGRDASLTLAITKAITERELRRRKRMELKSRLTSMFRIIILP